MPAPENVSSARPYVQKRSLGSGMVCRLQTTLNRGHVGTSAIIAAYNEEGTLADVVRGLRASPLIDEIIVVSDGSTDRTVEIARSLDVKTIALRENQGKGYAMRVGVDNAYSCSAATTATTWGCPASP